MTARNKQRHLGNGTSKDHLATTQGRSSTLQNLTTRRNLVEKLSIRRQSHCGFWGKTGIKSLPVRSCEPRNPKSLLCGMGCVGDSTWAYFQNRNVFWFRIRMKESWNIVIFPIHLVISVLYVVSETTPNSIHKTHKIHQPPVATSTKKHFNIYIYIIVFLN